MCSTASETARRVRTVRFIGAGDDPVRVVDCLVLRCPVCERLHRLPADGTTADQLHDRIAGHVVDSHPETPHGEAEALIERTLEGVEIRRVDVDPEELGGWRANSVR